MADEPRKSLADGIPWEGTPALGIWNPVSFLVGEYATVRERADRLYGPPRPDTSRQTHPIDETARPCHH